MITISSDLKVNFSSKDDGYDYLHKDSSEERLFVEIRKFLSQRGFKENQLDIGGGYSLGRISTGGNDPDISLFFHDGYWLVTHGERGGAHMIGLFKNEHEAVNCFISQFVRPETIDWKAVFA